MEQQLITIESRMARREQELLGAVEAGELAMRMDRSRLQAIHEQEIREKDEQLIKFQSELSQLVYCLRQWQQMASDSGLKVDGATIPLPGAALTT